MFANYFSIAVLGLAARAVIGELIGEMICRTLTTFTLSENKHHL